MTEPAAACAGILLLTLAPGVLIAGALAPVRRLILFPAGLLIGIGVTSLLYFWMHLFGAPVGLAAAAEGSLLLTAAALWGRRWGSQGTDWRRSSEWAGIAVLVLCVFIGLGVYQAAARAPHGQWDAWAIWNMRARFLFRGADLGTVFSAGYAWSHPDYPLLVPGIVAHWWEWLGGELQQAPAALGALFTGAAPLVLFCAVARLVSLPAALLAGSVFFVNGSYLAHGAIQYADNPLSAYFLLSLAFYAFYDAEENAPGWAALAGLCAGLAAWTKNEGALFLAALAAGRLMLFRWRRDRARGIEELKAVVLGASAPVVTLAVFKGAFSPGGDLAPGLLTGLGEKLLDPARHESIWRAFAGYFESLPSPLLPIVAGIAGLSILERRGIAEAAFTPLVVMAAMHTGYFVVYLTTPYDLPWHLDTSFSRLMVQLWPSLVFAACLLAAPPPFSNAPPLLARSGMRSAARLLRPRP